MRRSYYWLPILSSFIFSACPMKFPDGHYEGNFIYKTQEGRLDEAVSLEVDGDFLRHKARVKIHDMRTQLVATMDIHMDSLRTVSVFIPLLRQEPFRLKKSSNRKNKTNQVDGISDSKCFVEKSSWTAHLCYNHGEFLFKAKSDQEKKSLTISASEFEKEKVFEIEYPIKELTLTEAIDRSFQYNFDSKIAFEQVVQAKNVARNAYLNLIPNLNSNILVNLDLTYGGMYSTFISAAHFLLPTKYLSIGETHKEKHLKEDALKVFRSELAMTVEELFYSLKRDLNILSAYQEALEGTIQIQKNKKATQQQMEQINAMVEQLETNLSEIRRVVKEDQFALSKALGFHNPEAIESIAIDEEILAIQEASPLEPEIIARAASRRSMEIRQIDHLITCAKLRRHKVWFNWFDPGGDSNLGLGPSVVTHLLGSKAEVKELKTKREQIKAELYDNAYRAVLGFNEAIKLYAQVGKEFQVNSDSHSPIRIDPMAILGSDLGLEKDSLDGKSIPIPPTGPRLPTDGLNLRSPKQSIQKAIQEKLDGIIQFETNMAAFRTARARIDRILLRGFYTRLMPHLKKSG